MQPLCNAIAQTYAIESFYAHHLRLITQIIAPKLTQNTVNERLNFLIIELKMSARAFSAAIGMPDSNTRNYLSKGTKLNSDYLESIARHFSRVDLNWLLTGQGQPFLPNPTPSSDSHNISTKNFQGNITGTNHGSMTQAVGTTTTLPDCEKDLTAAHEKIALLTSQLADKERTIQILLKQTS